MRNVRVCPCGTCYEARLARHSHTPASLRCRLAARMKLRLLALKRLHDHIRHRSNARSAIEVAMHDKPHVIPLRALGPYPHERGKSSRKVGGDLTDAQSRCNSLSEHQAGVGLESDVRSLEGLATELVATAVAEAAVVHDDVLTRQACANFGQAARVEVLACCKEAQHAMTEMARDQVRCFRTHRTHREICLASREIT